MVHHGIPATYSSIFVYKWVLQWLACHSSSITGVGVFLVRMQSQKCNLTVTLVFTRSSIAILNNGKKNKIIIINLPSEKARGVQRIFVTWCASQSYNPYCRFITNI